MKLSTYYPQLPSIMFHKVDHLFNSSQANDEIYVELEIFGPHEINVTDYTELEQLRIENNLNCTKECYETATRGVGWQSIHGCADNYTGDADGKCHKTGDSSYVDRALAAFIQKARDCIECIAGLIYYDYTDVESDLEEYSDLEEMLEFDKRNEVSTFMKIKIPR